MERIIFSVLIIFFLPFSFLLANENWILIYDKDDPTENHNIVYVPIALKKVIKHKLKSYLNEKYANKKSCNISIFDEFHKGKFITKSTEYLVEFQACNNLEVIGCNDNGIAIFKGDTLISVIEMCSNFVKKIPDLNRNGSNEIIIEYFDTHHSDYTTTLEIIDIKDNSIKKLYSENVFKYNYNYGLNCYSGISYENLKSNLFVKLSTPLIFKQDKYIQAVNKCNYKIKDYELSESRIISDKINNYQIKRNEFLSGLNKGFNTTKKIKFYNSFHNFYSIQIFSLKNSYLEDKDKLINLSKITGYDLIEYYATDVAFEDRLHILIGRFSDKEKALKTLSLLHKKYPEENMFNQRIPQIRYFNGKKWVSVSNYQPLAK